MEDSLSSYLPAAVREITLHTAVLTFCASLPLIALISYIFYQLYLHPLAKYPGPLLGRVTPLYDLYHAYIGDKHLLFYHLHQRYGRIVRFTPNTLSINDPAALKAIYSRHANARKSEFYRCFRAAPTAISTLLATDKDHHARKRRIMSQAFSPDAMKGMEQYVLQHVDTLVSALGESAVKPDDRPHASGKDRKWSKPLDLQKWANYFVFDVMGELVFGKSFHTMDGSVGGEGLSNRRGIKWLMRAARRNYTIAAMPMLMHRGLEKWLPPFRGLYQDRNQYLAFGKQQVMAKMERDKKKSPEDEKRKDIFSILLHAKDPETGEGVPMPELWMEGNTLIVAGSDTSSTTLAATLFYLVRNPAVLTRLEHEIRSTFSRAQDIRWNNNSASSPTNPASTPADSTSSTSPLQTLPWLRACIDETLRMSPAVPGLLPREILPGGLPIPSLNLHLPAGTNVGVPIYALHHLDTHVPNAFTFDPSRWLPSTQQHWHVQDRSALHAVFNPFSTGVRACLGKPLVYMEISVAVATVVWEFDLRAAAGVEVGDGLSQREEGWEGVRREIASGKRDAREYQMQDWFLSNNFGPWVELRRRRLDGDVEGEGEKVDSGVEDWEE